MSEDYRTSVDDVRGGGFKTELSDPEIREWIADANLEVEERLADTGMSERRLATIEKYLARHLIKFIVERQLDLKKVGDASKHYSGAFTKEGLLATAPGQTAVAKDTSDTLGPENGDFWSVTV